MRKPKKLVVPFSKEPTPFRRFNIVRAKDVSGVSGIGIVAVGCEYPDFSCTVKWLGEIHSLGVYANIGELNKVHGHGGATKVVFIDK